MLEYDSLVIGTGAISARPTIAGLNLPGVFSLRTMDDAFALRQYAARTGLRDAEARLAGFSPRTAEFEGRDHKEYYPGAQPLLIRITADRVTRRLLGAQMLGRHGTKISKRIDVFATAIHNGMTIMEISDLDLSYTPPLSSPWYPVQAAAHWWLSQTS